MFGLGATQSPLTTDNEKGYSLRVLMVNTRLLAQDLVANGRGMEALIQAQQLTEIAEHIQTRKITQIDQVWARINQLGLEKDIDRILEENQKGVESLMKESKSLNYFLTKSMSRINDGIRGTSYTPQKRSRGVGISRQSKDLMTSMSAMNERNSERIVPTFIGLTILQSTATSFYKLKAIKKKKGLKRSNSYELAKIQPTRRPKLRANSLGFNKKTYNSNGLQRHFTFPWDLDLETAVRGNERYVVPWNRF